MATSFKIKDIFADHWDAFLDQGYPVRPAVLKNVQKIASYQTEWLQTR